MDQFQLPQPFVLDRSRSASAQVFDYLRLHIINLSLKPATPLPRPALAEHFDLSQTPIRDALLRLEEEGLVAIYPQHATVVRAIDVASAQRAHFLRKSLEIEVVRTLARDVNDSLIARLDIKLSQQADALRLADFDEFVLKDHDFHRTMYAAAKVEPLWEMVRRASGNLDRLRNLHLPMPGKAQSVIDEHRHIVRALAARDVQAVEAAVRAHLSGTLSNLAQIRVNYASYLMETTG
ncbi:transcriptional regulator, GntR family [Duganella sp. CF517]|uniref:GntR family transcriptional regulator n=1 Tax=Duganella sp. CF517 TaxID=1881038 RepID=UPI0008CDCA7B|nr:GntR family transcriptional regulator [Duganella sp. CF517]SEN09899.1 transcriptional regulator, GntR family [Duganella sp. CF517]